MTPSPQKDRPIRIVGTAGSVDLVLRPEDLAWTEPSRLSVVNTFAGAWIDSFGPGIGVITISGTTGWRGGNDGDWLARFQNLRDVAFANWHAASAGLADLDPIDIFFIDMLDRRVAKVVPKEFTLKRNKARPLFLQYTIQFLVVEDLDWNGDDNAANFSLS